MCSWIHTFKFENTHNWWGKLLGFVNWFVQNSISLSQAWLARLNHFVNYTCLQIFSTHVRQILWETFISNSYWRQFQFQSSISGRSAWGWSIKSIQLKYYLDERRETANIMMTGKKTNLLLHGWLWFPFQPEFNSKLVTWNSFCTCEVFEELIDLSGFCCSHIRNMLHTC